MQYIEREWETLQNLPKISVLNGTPMSRADLRQARQNVASMLLYKFLNASAPLAAGPGTSHFTLAPLAVLLDVGLILH